MPNRTRPARLALVCAALGLTAAVSGASAQAPASEVFGLTKVHDFHLELSAAEWDKMQAVRGGVPMFGGFGPKKPPEKAGAEPADRHKSPGFGLEFPWAHADLTAGGRTYRDVGLRYKGNGSYVASTNGLKRNFKIELDRYAKGQRFHGLKTVTLNAGAMDPGRLREALAYAVFREAGVPAPRTAFARVTLTVPGKFDKEFVGLYTFVEHVDKTFLRDRFKTDKGLLLKPEGLRGIDYLGEDWEPYKGRYRPKREPTKKEARRLIEFARLVNKADDAQFNKQVGAYLNVDEFLRFMAVNAFLANLDSFFTIGHNYYAYLDPATNKFLFLPWDLDLAFAGFPMMGTPEQQMDLSLTHPHLGPNKLIDRLLAVPGVRERYQKVLRELAATCFAKEKLLADVAALEMATEEILAREKKAVDARKEAKGGFGFGMFGKSPDLRTFVAKRTASVTAQLADPNKGFVPKMGFGFGGPPGGPKGEFGGPKGGPGGFGPGNFFAKPLLTALDTDKDGAVTKAELAAAARKFFDDTDKDKKGKLDEKALAAGLNRLFPPPPGFGPPPGKAPGGPPGGFGPGTFLAGAVMKRADADKDGWVTRDELVAAAEALFKEADKTNKGRLDEAGLAVGINLLFPPPPAFGPPGGRPPEPKKKETP